MVKSFNILNIISALPGNTSGGYREAESQVIDGEWGKRIRVAYGKGKV